MERFDAVLVRAEVLKRLILPVAGVYHLSGTAGIALVKVVLQTVRIRLTVPAGAIGVTVAQYHDTDGIPRRDFRCAVFPESEIVAPVHVIPARMFFKVNPQGAVRGDMEPDLLIAFDPLYPEHRENTEKYFHCREDSTKQRCID
jgi:hypothetical protein